MVQIQSALGTFLFLVALSGNWLNVADGCVRNRWRVGPGTLGVGGPGEAGGSGLYIGIRYTIPFRKRRDAEKVDYSDIYHACNSDGNDGLSLDEMKKCFPQPSHLLAKTFSQLDKDKDDALSLKEFERATLNLGFKPDVNCHTNMLQRCGYSFVLYSRARDPTTTTMCDAMQAYIDCVGRKKQKCDRDDTKHYTAMLSEMVATTSEEGICPNITIEGLGSDKGVNLHELPCSKSAIMLCDISFMEDLHTGVDACVALDAYEKCMFENRLGCEDDPSLDALKEAQNLLQAYLSTGMCS